MALENSKQNIVLDLTYPVLQNIRCVQYDTESRIIGITITDNSKLYKILDTYGIIFKQSKPDGTFVERKDACTILSDGTIELLLPEQSTTCPGLSKCQLEIIDNSVIHTLHFNLVVEKSVIGNQDIESQVDSDILTDMNKHLTDYDNPHKMPIASDKELGIIKSGTDITVDDSGNVSVNDNSHKHTVSNISDLTATAAELNVLDGITATTTELNYTDGVTSNIQTQLNSKAPLASPTLSGTPTAPTASAGTNTTQIATTAFVQTAVSNGIAASDALIFKGTLGTSGTVTALPTTYKTGWTYRVITAGTYAGQVCEIGDLIVALVDRSGSGNLDADWCVAQTNIDGAITGIKSGDAYIEVSQTDSVATIKHKDISRTNTTSTAKPSHGGTFTAVDSVTSDSKGHVTGINTKTVTLPSTAVTVDSSLSSTSTNPLQNKAVYNALSGKANSSHSHAISDVSGLQSSLSDCFTASQPRTANTVLAAPNGSNGGASFRALVAEDLPSHSHNYAGSYSAGGAAISLEYFKNTSNAPIGQDTSDSNAIGYTQDYSGEVLTANIRDGALYRQVHSTPWAHEIYGDYRTGQIAVRGRNNGTWQSWRRILDEANYKNFCTPANIGALPTSASCNRNWNWSGQGGQPTWLWGGEDGTNMYVYCPANFSVNYANSSGSATLDGNGNNIASTYVTKSNPSSSGTLSHNGTATGADAVALGYGANASGNWSRALSNYSTASGVGSVVLGYHSTASGVWANSLGFFTTALDRQTVIGHHNDTSLANSLGDYVGSNSGTAFVIGNGTDSSHSNAFRVRFDGIVYSKGSYTNSGADYAEYLEWSDGNANNEDRRGYVVTFDEENPGKIRKANSNDYVVGIVSGNPCILGNSDEGWLGQYLRDDFGTILTEEIEEEIETIDPDTDETVMKKQKSISYIVNPDYDPQKVYVHRENRPEWDAIGFLGVLIVRDDNTCVANGYCKVSEGGIMTSSEKGTETYKVIERVTDNLIKVLIK